MDVPVVLLVPRGETGAAPAARRDARRGGRDVEAAALAAEALGEALGQALTVMLGVALTPLRTDEPCAYSHDGRGSATAVSLGTRQ